MDPSLIIKKSRLKKSLYLKLLINKKKNQKETKQKFKLLEAAIRRAYESPRYVLRRMSETIVHFMIKARDLAH